MSNNNKVVATVSNDKVTVTATPTTTRVSTGQTSAVASGGAKVVTASIDNSTATSTGVGVKGDAGLTFRGSWSAGNSYDSGDIVEYEGSSYVSTQGAAVGQDTPDINSSWFLLVSKGDMGNPGDASTERGPKGDIGNKGTTGDTGGDSTVPGPRGLTGLTGDTGSTGPSGREGENGQDGRDGRNGTDGSDGIDGTNGADGDSGPRGDAGSRGDKGEKGNVGPTGTEGARGTKGNKGSDGRDGTDGTDGAEGQEGSTGPQGADSTVPGPTGVAGPRGTQGIQGEDSIIPGPIGETGDRGPRGTQGTPFAYDDFTDSQIRDLTGSRGADGTDGTPGEDGEDGSDGEDGDRGPRGDQGSRGDKGDTGDESTIAGPTGPRGDRGERGPVSVIPGPDGDEGPRGQRGPQGNTTIWRSGTTVPAEGIGAPGDYFFETDAKIFYRFTVQPPLTKPTGDWLEIASLPGQFADTPNRGNTLGIDFVTEGGVVRGTIDAAGISGGGGTSTSVGILDLPGLNSTAINSSIVLTDGRCSGPNDLGQNAFLDGLETEGACLAANPSNAWAFLEINDQFLIREIGEHLVTADEVTNGIKGLLQVSILSVEGVDLSTINFTVELGGATQTFILPPHGGVVDLDLSGFDSAGLHKFTISKDTGGVVSGSFAVVLNNEGGQVIIKPAVRESLDELYDLTFNDTDNAERKLGVDFTRVVIDTDDDADITRNRDIITATVDTRSLNLSVPGFEHEGTTGVTEFVPATNEVTTITYSGTTASTLSEGTIESTIITIGENSVSGKLTTTPEFIDISDELTNATSVAYDGSGIYVAIANGNKLYVSTDGDNWTLSPYNLPTNLVASLSSVTYGNGMFITVGKRADGDHIIFYTVSIQAPNVVWNFNRFESLAQGGTLDVKYFNSRFWYYGGDSSGNNKFLLRSSGIGDPTNASLAETSLILDMDGNNTNTIVIGHNKLGTISYTVGSGWNTTTLSTDAGTGVVTSVVHGNGNWYVGTSTGQFWISSNISGEAWIKSSQNAYAGNTSRVQPGVYAEGRFVIPTANGDVYYSTFPSASTWTKLTLSGVSLINKAWAGGERYFLTGTNIDDIFQVARLDDRTEVTLTLPDHLTNPLTFFITSESNANSMATQIAAAINNANPNNLSTATAGNNRVSFSATVAGDNLNGSISFFSHSEILSPVTTFAVTDGESDQSNAIKDTMIFYNLDINNGHSVNQISVSLDFGLTGDTFRDSIVSTLEIIGGYTIDITVDGIITVTSDNAGSETNLSIFYTQANDSTATLTRSVNSNGEDSVATGDLTSLTYTIEDVSYDITFPSGVATSNQQALFARSTINTIRGNPITDGTDFVMSVNGDLLNFRLPEGVIASDHTIALNPPATINSPPYTGGTLVNASNPVGTYVLPVIASNVLSLTEFRDTVSTAEYKGVDFTEDKSVVAGKVAYTWNDYTAGGLFQELTTDNSGTTVKLQFSKTDDGLTTAFVYRRIIGAGTTDYSDIVYAEESLTTILATRGG